MTILKFGSNFWSWSKHNISMTYCLGYFNKRSHKPSRENFKTYDNDSANNQKHRSYLDIFFFFKFVLIPFRLVVFLTKVKSYI